MQVYELMGPFLFSHVLVYFFDQIFFNTWNLSLLCGIRMTALLWKSGLLFWSFCIRLNSRLIFWPEKKRELYWPASDQLFMDFPSEIHKPSNAWVRIIRLISLGPCDSCFASKAD